MSRRLVVLPVLLLVLCCSSMRGQAGLKTQLSAVVFASVIPTEVVLSLPNLSETLACQPRQPQGFVCSGDIPTHDLSSNLSTQLTLSASWPDGGSEELYLRLPRVSTNKKIEVRIYHRTLDVTLASVAAIDARGTDLLSSYQSYYEARYLYRKMRPINASHVVTLRSCRLWFDAAYRLAEPSESVVAMDPQALKAASECKQLAWGAPANSHIRVIVNPGYIQGMTMQVDAMEWRGVAEVPKLLQSGHLEFAAALNSFYLDKFESLNGDETKIPLHEGVTRTLLTENAQYIAKLKTKQ